MASQWTCECGSNDSEQRERLFKEGLERVGAIPRAGSLFLDTLVLCVAHAEDTGLISGGRAGELLDGIRWMKHRAWAERLIRSAVKLIDYQVWNEEAQRFLNR